MKKPDKSKTNIAELESDVVQAQAVVAAAQTRVAESETAYRVSLTAADPKAPRAAQDVIHEAKIALDRANALQEIAIDRLRLARRAEDEEQRCARYDEAKKLSNDARTKLTQEYVPAACKIVDILIAIAQADVAIASVNDDLPRGCSAIESPEAVRSIAGVPAEIVREEVVELWTYPETGNPIPDGSRVRETTPGSFALNGVEVEKRPFRKLTELVAARSYGRDPLALKLALPGFDGLTEIWEQSPAYITSITPDDVLRQAAGLREQLAQEKREKTAKRNTRTRLEPLPAEPTKPRPKAIASSQVWMS